MAQRPRVAPHARRRAEVGIGLPRANLDVARPPAGGIVLVTPAERASAHNAAKLLSNPRDRAKWLSSLGEDRAGYVAALRGQAPLWFGRIDREYYAEIGRLLGPKIVGAL